MAWTAPRTWTVGEVPTAAVFNTHLRDNFLEALHRYVAPDTTTIDVTSSVTETSLYSFTVAAGDLGTSRLLVARLAGDMQYNVSGANATLKIKYGATTISSGTFNSATAAANRRGWTIEVGLAALGATNSQWFWCAFVLGEATSPAGGMRIDATNQGGGVIFGATTVDSTVAQTLDVTWQWGTSSASLSMRKKYAAVVYV